MGNGSPIRQKRSKADLVIAYGDKPQEMVPALLDHLAVAAQIPRGNTIGIKPNLVVAKPSYTGATTDPEIVASIVGYLQDHGFRKIEILESAWLGDSTQEAFRVCGYHELAQKYQVPLVDLKQDASLGTGGTTMDIQVCKRMFGVEYLINVPVLKAHCQTKSLLVKGFENAKAADMAWGIARAVCVAVYLVVLPIHTKWLFFYALC